MSEALENMNQNENKDNDVEYIAILADEYGLPNLNFVGVSDKGVSSHNVIMEAEDGRRFFVKQYKEDDAERRESSNLVERHVAANSSIPVVLPLETTDGVSQMYVGDKMYAVFPFQDHNDSLPEDQVEKKKQNYELAKTLGTIHSVSMDNLDERIDVIDRWNPGGVADLVAHLEMIEGTIRNKEELDEFDKKALKTISQRKEILGVLDGEGSVSVADAICHGDYHSQNVLFDNDYNVTGVIDWDICAKSDPYIDFLNTFKMTIIGRKYETYQEERKETAKAFIKGYLDGLASDFDRDRLRNAAKTLTQVIAGSSWPLDEHYFMDYTKADGHLEKELDKAKFFSENADNIVEFIDSLLDKIERGS